MRSGVMMGRREAVRLAALLPWLPLLAAVRQQEGATAAPQDTGAAAPELYDPMRAGRPRERITDYENDPFIMAVESRLRCTCGCTLDVYTCRTTDFTCATSPAMHREVVALVEQGKTAQQILDAFVAQYGETVLMAPAKKGFNLAAYFVPGLAITAVGALLVWILARRRGQVAVETGPAGDVPGLSADDQARLDAELRDLER